MAIDLTCPKCSRLLSLGDDSAGKQFSCPHCQVVLVAPKTVIREVAAQDSHVHPLVWAAIGGGIVALLAWAFAVGISFWQPPSVAAKDKQTLSSANPFEVVAKSNLSTAENGKRPSDTNAGKLSTAGTGTKDPVVTMPIATVAATSKVSWGTNDPLVYPQPSQSAGVAPRGTVGAAADSSKPPMESTVKSAGQSDTPKPDESLSPSPTPLSAQDLYDRIASSVVTIEVNDDNRDRIYSGSGFFIDAGLLRGRYDGLESDKLFAKGMSEEGVRVEAAYVLTNFHVIRPAVSADIILLNGDKGTAFSVIAEDEKVDLALLFVTVPSNRSMKGIPLALDDPRIGATVFAIGSPEGFRSTISPGIVSGIRETSVFGHCLQTTTPISHGSSGGPLLLTDGTIAGVTSGGLDGAQNVNFAVPVSTIRAFLSSRFRSREIAEGASLKQEVDRAFDGIFFTQASYTDDQKHAIDLLGQAREEIAKEHYDHAITLARDANKYLPNRFNYLAAYIMGKSSCWLAYNEVWPTLKSYESRYGRYRANEHADAAFRQLTQVTKSSPDFSPGFESLVLHYQFAGDWADALISSDTLVKLMPRCARAFALRAECYKELKQPEAAMRDLETALELAPRDASMNLQMAEVFANHGDYREAAALYESALALDLTQGQRLFANFNMADAFRKSGEFEKAVSAYEQAKVLGTPAFICDEEIAKCKRGER